MRDLCDDVRDLGRGKDIGFRADPDDDGEYPESPELMHECPTCRVTEGVSCNTPRGNSHRSRLVLLRP